MLSIKYRCLIFCLSIVYNFAFSQDLRSVADGLDYKQIDKAKLKTEFAKIATGNTFSSIGNFASIGTKSETLNASFFFMLKNNNVLNIEMTGGATQGITTIFDEGELNRNAKIGMSYNLLLRTGRNAIAINSTAEDVLRLEIENLNRKYQKKLIDVAADKYTKDIEADMKRLVKLRKGLMIKDSILNSKIDSLKNIEIVKFKDFETHKALINSLVSEKEIIAERNEDFRFLFDELQSRKNAFHKNKYNEVWNAVEKEHKSKVNDLRKKIYGIKPSAVSFSWISFGASIKNNTFKFFDPVLEIDKQVFNESYNTISASISYNHMSNARLVDRENGKIKGFKNKNREFFSVGLKYLYGDNLESLKQVEIRDSETIDESTGRVKLTKTNAFTGDYQKELDNLTAFVDYYYFLGKDDKLAFHLSPVLLVREKFKPVSSFQFGVLLPFKNRDKQTTTVNVEFFYKLKDVFNTTENENALLNRNLIGIQASFPFNF